MIRGIPRFAASLLCLIAVAIRCSSRAHDAALLEASVHEQRLTPGIVLALQQGATQKGSLRAWSSWAADINTSSGGLPPIWVLCSDAALEALVRETPYTNAFVVDEAPSWAEMLTRFLAQNEELSGVGLLGEGTLPHPDLAHSILSVRLGLAKAKPPTAILTRSRSSDGIEGEKPWLSDKFISQIWCNRPFLEESRLKDAGLEKWGVKNLTLLEVLPHLVLETASNTFLVDGTYVLPSVCAPTSPAADSGKASNRRGEEDDTERIRTEEASDESEGTDLYIGRLRYALAFMDGGNPAVHTQHRISEGGAMKTTRSHVVKSHWPPAYVLENVASGKTAESNGLVIVTNANCGYLDMATNFYMSVKATSDAKVLFVAMDEVAFDFLDALDPGSTALFTGSYSERHHHVKAGKIGDEVFAAQVLVRPRILYSILRKGYSVLWTDSDMVWLNNPLSLLPEFGANTPVDMMLQYDAKLTNVCTCFMFLNPTVFSRLLLRKWEKNIVDTESDKNQEPLGALQMAGLRVSMIPSEFMPAGREFFDHDYENNYVQLYHNQTKIVHNNWVRGHEAKKSRFQSHHLWSVENITFPDCGDRRH